MRGDRHRSEGAIRTSPLRWRAVSRRPSQKQSPRVGHPAPQPRRSNCEPHDSFELRAAMPEQGHRAAAFVRYRSSSSGRSARTHGSFEWPSRSAVDDPPDTRGQIASRGRLLLRRLEPKGGRIPWPVRSCPSSSSGGASVTVVGRRCSPIGVQKRRLGVDLDGGCSRNPLGERQRDQRGRSGCRRSSDPRELEQRLGLGRA